MVAERLKRARQKLLSAAVKATGRKGFRATLARFERHRDEIHRPEKTQ
jgi:hypothetical protein